MRTWLYSLVCTEYGVVVRSTRHGRNKLAGAVARWHQTDALFHVVKWSRLSGLQDWSLLIDVGPGLPFPPSHLGRPSATSCAHASSLGHHNHPAITQLTSVPLDLYGAKVKRHLELNNIIIIQKMQVSTAYIAPGVKSAAHFFLQCHDSCQRVDNHQRLLIPASLSDCKSICSSTSCLASLCYAREKVRVIRKTKRKEDNKKKQRWSSQES